MKRLKIEDFENKMPVFLHKVFLKIAFGRIMGLRRASPDPRSS
ncbi:hypothetical protein D1BOALGB6SA_648 [Olavius sp. associated proteobacterium Delta 1]|nr:hypothetical protein D1BOALGB6SA_648 [Olavius sp. associated proteobacterium Delta 1]